MRKWRLAIGCAVFAMPGAAWAGETPLYQSAPTWVAPLPLGAPDLAKVDDGAPAILILDSQRRVEKGRVWTYVDTAMRMATPELLAQAGTVSIPWSPDQGDLLVHRVEIVRGGERIDLVKGGQRFSVLRREEGLERRALNGLLTATLPVQGLQVGDVLRVTVTITAADPALAGQVQAITPMMTAPTPVGVARVRLLWPESEKIHWKVHGEGATPVEHAGGGYREVTLAMPLPKQPDMPDDAPARFRGSPMLEAGSFATWADVSRVFAPLYKTDGLIVSGDALDREVQAIKAATADPVGRAGQALHLVQDKVRYLLLGMAGGNYTPQSPARTWEMRYGDCKAKTLMLLAMLRHMGIEAEPVLVSSSGGDLLPARLPTPGAFDHVIVRATIGGETLWLDGTQSGTRLADLRDTPAFRYSLPLRTAGATLLPVPMRAPARPETEVTLDLDESVDQPTLFKANVVMRGPIAAQVAIVSGQAAPEQKREMVTRIVGAYLSDALLADYQLSYDAGKGEAMVTASGVASTSWSREDRRYRRIVDRAASSVSFEPNRARPAWKAIPVVTADPSSTVYRTRIRLPDGGRGFAIEGERDFTGTLGGVTVRRTAALADGLLSIEERVDTSGIEIAPTEIPAERSKLALAKARMPKLVAPADTARHWQLASRPAHQARLKAIDSAFGKAIEADPKQAEPYHWRAEYRAGVGNWAGATEDLGRAIAIEPTVQLHLRRAELRRELGQDKAALTDMEAALQLDPASQDAIIAAADLRSELGEGKAVLALLQEKIDLGGKERFGFIRAKADVQADMGDVAGAIATLDEAIKDKPGDPDLLNARCWIKATRNVALDTALKDCTKSIELSDNPQGALDSRAMVYYRLKRPEDALADLEVALDAAPEQAASLYLRALVLKGVAGRAGDGEADLAAARALEPRIERTYRRYGVTP